MGSCSFVSIGCDSSLDGPVEHGRLDSTRADLRGRGQK